MAEYIENKTEKVHFHCPQVANSPEQVITQLQSIIEQYPQDEWFVVGSSLGGYFATYFSEQYNIKAVLINPAIKPYELLADYVGEQVNPYTQEHFWVKTEHMEQLKALEQVKITGNNYLVMVQTGDEVLDYQLTEQKFKQAQLIVQKGGDHSFINFEKMLPVIDKFLQLPNNK